eukprot:1800050-Rhodomonas_salina.1
MSVIWFCASYMSAMRLPARYTMLGTEIAYGATRVQPPASTCSPPPVQTRATVLRIRYQEMCGTESRVSAIVLRIRLHALYGTEIAYATQSTVLKASGV